MLIELVMSVPMLLYWSGMTGPSGTVLIWYLLYLPVLYYRWFVAVTALETAAAVAVGFVALEFAIGVVISLAVF